MRRTEREEPDPMSDSDYLEQIAGDIREVRNIVRYAWWLFLLVFVLVAIAEARGT